MTALRLRLREKPPERVDMSCVTPAGLGGLTPNEMARLPIGTNRIGLRLGDCFEITSGDPADIRIEGGSSRLDQVGAALPGGLLHVDGDVGQRLGWNMRAGALHVTGSAGPFAGSGARGGLIVIDGDADEKAGGALHGAMAGLDGATLVIRGHAGARLGDRMRGGLIAAASAGDHTGSRLIAGTIVAGTVGDYAGYAMRRGTLLVGEHGLVLPTFVETGVHRFVYIRLLRRALITLAPQLAELAGDDVHRRAGDLATLGKGELLTPCR
jgi:formylmethanofuran dehydrogenase subunit C